MPITIKSEREIELMTEAGRILGIVHKELEKALKPGMSTLDIDALGEEVIRSYGCEPSFLNYNGYPASICVSVNDEIVHGIPSAKHLIKEGDIVSLDAGVIYKGYHSDSAYTYIIGKVDKDTERLVNETRRALYEGIKVVKAGIKLNDVCSAIGKVAKENGFGVFECLTGHGVGRNLHEDPYIPNLSNHESEGIILKEGMTLAIEPMFSLGTKQVWLLEDEWGIVTRDGSPAAHFEHTILVTKDGYEILTGE